MLAYQKLPGVVRVFTEVNFPHAHFIDVILVGGWYSSDFFAFL